MGHTSPRQWRSSTTKRQPRWIGRLFPLALLLAGTVLMGSVPARAGTTISDYGNGSCVDDDHWVNAKTDPNWTCQINIEGFGLGGVSEQTLDYADHHILTVTDGAADPCSVDNKKGKLPTGTPKFCFKVGNEVRGVWNWSNSKGVSSKQGTLAWLKSVEQIGSSTQTADCKSELTVAGRCPNRLSSGFSAFYEMGGEGGSSLRDLDTSNLQDMNAMFRDAKRFNEDISAWDTAKVTNMSNMFFGASAFNQDIGGWDTSSVGNMALMFTGAAAFNHNIGGWDTSKVSIMSGMFMDATAFNQDIGGWATRRVLNMDYMFASYADVPTSFNRDLSGWDVRLIEGEPESFREGTAATWAGIAGTAWCNEGQPQWGTDGTSGCSTAQGPDEIIEAIASGGTVIGTECVNGKVDEILNSGSNPTLIPYGPDQTLYVKVSGTTRLKRASGYKWNAGATTNVQDKVRFMPIDSGPEGNSHYIKKGTSENSLAEFGKGSDGAPENVVQGQGTHQMVFRSASEIYEPVVLGTMYTATLNTSDFTYSCIPAGLLPPDKPTNVVAEAHASGGMLVTFEQKGPGGDPTYYTYEAENYMGRSRTGRVVDADSDDDTSSPFLIIANPPFGDDPGEWRVKITAVNAAGEATSAWSNWITPSVEEPPVPDASEITSVATGNGSATINFNAPNDNGMAITNYAYRLTGEFDDPGDFITLDPPIVESPITVAGLVNGKTYTVSIAAINANGMGPDSNEEEFTVGTQCEDVTDWTAPADTLGYFCSIGLNDYAYADFHILTTNGTDVCAARGTYLPTAEGNYEGLFCSHTNSQLRAIFNWNNGSRNKDLTWLVNVDQIGSRTKVGVACGNFGQTAAVRCANQLAGGKRAFQAMLGEGGDGILNLDIANLTSLEEMFFKASNFNEDITDWDVGHVKNLRRLFEKTSFNRDIGVWDTGSVVNMSSMFNGTPFNHDIGSWDTSNVTTMVYMFTNTNQFDQDISRWNTSNVANMAYMFRNTARFNQDISTKSVTGEGGTSYTAWDVSAVTSMDSMFDAAKAFNQDIGNWDTSAVEDMKQMFKGAIAFNQDLSGWVVAADVVHDDFDQRADAWCGLGIYNRGRPGNWDPLSDGVSCAVMLSLDAPPSVVAGDELTYTLNYYNESPDSFTGTLTLDLPNDVTLTTQNISHGGTQSGRTITWPDVTVPAYTSADGGGGEVSVTVKVSPDELPSSEANPRILEASATLAASGAEYVSDVAETELTSEAILMVTLEANEQVMAGELITYQVTVRNDGLSRSQDATINLTLVSEAASAEAAPTFSFEDDAGVCAGTVCNWTSGNNLEPGGERTATVSIRVADDAGEGSSIKANLIAFSSNAAQTSEREATVSTEITAQPVPALDITLQTLPTAVVALGDEFKALIEVTNRGAAAAKDTTVTLDVPAGASFVSALGGGTESGGLITWNVAELVPVNGATQLVASLRAPNVEGGVELTAEAVTTAILTNGNSQETSARVTESLRVDDAPVLDLQLAMSPDPVAPGDELAMRFTYQNMGHLAANDVVLTSRVPAETTLDLDASSDASCSADPCVAGSTVTVDVGTLQAQANGTARLVLVVDNDTTALQISGVGALAGKNGVDASVPQAASASVQVVDGPIFEVTQRAERDYVAPGGLVTYQIDYENRGLAAATSVVLDDVIPADTRVQAAPGASETDSGVRWSTNLLTEGQSGSVMTRLEVTGNAVVGATLGNMVALSDANQTVYAEPYDVVVTDGAVLETTMATLPQVAAPGKPFIYQVSYANKGTADATNATLQLAVPANVTVGSCDGCTVAGNRLTWDLGTVASGAADSKQVVVTVSANVPEYTSLYAASYISEAAATAQSAGAQSRALASLSEAQRPSLDASERTTTSQQPGPLTLASTLVARAPATEITATATDQVIPGGQISVQASIANAGSATATGTTLETRLPAGTTLVFDGTQATCSANPCVGGSTLSWSLGTLLPGAERSVSYALAVDADADLGQRRHVLELDSNEEREQIAEATTNVAAGALTLDKSVTDADGTRNPTYAGIGDAVTYTLTIVNDNPAATPDLVVTDVLPAEVIACGSCLNLTGSGASLSGNTLTWSNIDLGARESITLSYGVTIPTVANNTALENLASVRSAVGQTDTDSARLVITAIAELGVTLAAPAGLQPDESDSVVIAYENTGTAATTATLRYLLPDYLSVTDGAGASVSGSTYTWSLGSLEAGATGSKTLTVKAAADAPANEVLTHFASIEGTAANLSAEASATTVIGSVEALAISVSAPSPLTTGDTFTATVVATNSGNTAANGTVVQLTLPAGFGVRNAAGGQIIVIDYPEETVEVVEWTLDLAAGATQTLLPTIGTPATADTGVLNAELVAASGLTQSASTTVQVNGLTSSLIQAAARFSVAEAMAGDIVTLTAGPVNIGGAASGAVTNAVVLSAGLTATAYDGASWNAGTRTLSWTTDSLASRGSDPKSFTVRVADEGALTAEITSDDSTGEASMVRTFPEEVTITPENPDSTCKLSGQPTVQAAPTPPAGVTLSFANTVGFTVIDCDRNPNTSYPETLSVTIDVGEAIDPDAKLFKVYDSGEWSVIEDAVISGQTVTYSITDDGELDQDKTPGTLRDPVALAFPEGEAPPPPPPAPAPIVPVPLPLWLWATLSALLGWLGFRRLSAA